MPRRRTTQMTERERIHQTGRKNWRDNLKANREAFAKDMDSPEAQKALKRLQYLVDSIGKPRRGRDRTRKSLDRPLFK